MASEPWHYPPSDPRSGLPRDDGAAVQLDPSRVRARGFIAGIKEKVAGLKRLGEAADRLDLGELVEQGLGLLLDDVVGPAQADQAGAAPRRPTSAPDPALRVTVSRPTDPADPARPAPRRIVEPWHVPPPAASRSSEPVCIALAHGHMDAHFARLPGCVEGPK